MFVISFKSGEILSHTCFSDLKSPIFYVRCPQMITPISETDGNFGEKFSRAVRGDIGGLDKFVLDFLILSV